MAFVVALLKYYPHIRLQKLRKITKGVRQNSMWPDCDLYPAWPKYKPRALLLHEPDSWHVSYYLCVHLQVRSCAYITQKEHNVHDHTDKEVEPPEGTQTGVSEDLSIISARQGSD
jgi:hypothetical protein